MTNRGLTLIEIVIGLAVIVIIAAVAVLNLFSVKSVQDLELDAKAIVSSLRDAQQRSITQEEDQEWGINFVKERGSEENFYELFNGSGFILRRNLKPTVEFQSADDEFEVAFEKLSGRLKNVPLAEIIIDLKSDPSESRTITINQNGTITYD